MLPDDYVCVCNRVSLRKLAAFMERTQPSVPSQLSECLGAGTGCQWCVPFLTRLFEQHKAGVDPSLPVSPEEYAKRRSNYHRTGHRDDAAERGQ